MPKGQEEAAARLQLMTTKPVLYVCNVEEGSAATGNAHSARVFERAAAEGAKAVVVSAAIEAEISQMAAADQAEFLESLGLEDSGLDRIIRAGYELLGLINEEPSISILVLAAGTGPEGPGPLVTHLAGKGVGKLRIPLTLVPGSLRREQLDLIT